ncbi:MAG TPA: response regulator [Trueperaceae bacterium]|jgi:CheY-like chemotaxis protein
MGSRQYLIADPDPGQRQLLDLLLSDGESTIAQVESAKQALEFLRTNTPALVVLAYELPGMAGTEVCKRLKLVARLQHVPVIVTVDPGEAFGVPEEVRAAAEDAGVDLLVPKPLGDKALRERATRLILAAELRQARAPARVKHDTAVIEESLKELDARQAGGAARPAAPGQDGQAQGARPAPRAPGGEAEEIERLRGENAKLKQRLLALQDQNDRLRAEVEELKRSRRGLFGRRR